jgi:hypothetical protein
VHWALLLAEPLECCLWGILSAMVADGRLSGMALACGRSVVVWLVVWRRVSMVIGLVL